MGIIFLVMKGKVIKIVAIVMLGIEKIIWIF